MLQFSANLGFLWQELSLPERIVSAKNAGFSAVECHFPYDTPPQLVADALRETGLPMLALNTHPGDVDSGEFGLCALPGKQQQARQVVDQAIDYARQINARRVHVMAGLSGDAEDVMPCFLENLVYAGTEAAKHNLGILIEPINRLDKPGYALHLTGQGVDLVNTLRSQHQLMNVGLMFDCYHVERGEGNVFERLKFALPSIAHIQIAAVPGRAEPDQGELDYTWLLAQIDTLGYQGFVGAEYVPAQSTDDGLGWFEPYRIGASFP